MRHIVLAVLMLFAIVGCGGSGEGSPIGPTVKLSVFWDARSRTANAPSSALSGTLSVRGAGGTEASIKFNRPSGAESVLQQVATTESVSIGQATYSLTFYSAADGTGDVVAEAKGTASIAPDGTGIGTVTTINQITLVEVAAGQRVGEGETKDLIATARNESGQVVAVSGGSVFWSAPNSAAHLRFENGRAVGIRRGSAKAVATVDRVASLPQTILVEVTPRAIEIMPVPGSDAEGITFLNGLSADGKVAVGTSRDARGTVAFKWTEATGTVALPTPAGFDTSGAMAVNADGTVIVGVCRNGSGPFHAVKWTAGGVQLLPELDGATESQATGVDADGGSIVGAMRNASGQSFSVVWDEGHAPRNFAEGMAYAISGDGSMIVGSLLRRDLNLVMGYAYERQGSVAFLEGFSHDQRMDEALAVNEDGSVVVGYHGDGTSRYPVIWTPTTSLTRIAGTITTSATSVSADGALIGGGAPEGGIAFLWHRETGTRHFVSLATAAGILTQFGSVSPGAVNGISADHSRFGVNCFPTGATVAPPRAFIVDLPNYMES